MALPLFFAPELHERSLGSEIRLPSAVKQNASALVTLGRMRLTRFPSGMAPE